MSETRRSVFLFEHLVFDIQHYIITYFISSQDLYSLALVSKSIHSLANTALYRHVRMLPGLAFKLVSPQLSGAYTKSLSLAQKTFARQIASSDKADRVRFLEWHMSSHGVFPKQAFLEVFPRLQNLQKLHIIDAHPTDMEERDLSIPPSLFPRLEEIKVSGITYLPFLLPILHTSYHLRSITVDAPDPHSIHLQLLQSLTTVNLRRVEKLELWASLSTEPSKVEEVIHAWNEVLYAIRNYVEEVVLGFRISRSGRRTCTKEEQQMLSSKLLYSLQPVFSVKNEWRNLKRLSFMGVSFSEENGLIRCKDIFNNFPQLSSAPQIQTSLPCTNSGVMEL